MYPETPPTTPPAAALPTEKLLKEHNASIPLHRLSIELIAATMVQGFPRLRASNNDHWKHWSEILKYLRVIGAVSSYWREIRNNTVALWSTICFQYSIVREKNYVALQTFYMFLIRSKEAKLDLKLDVGLYETSLDRNPLPVVVPFLDRCQSLLVWGRTFPNALTLFPLPKNIQKLQSLEINIPAFTLPPNLFAEDNGTRLSSLVLPNLSLHEFSVKNINSSNIVRLDLGHVMSLEYFAFIMQCPLLEELTAGPMYKAYSSLDDVELPVILLPHLTYLSIMTTFPYDYLHVLNCPQLLHLKIIHSIIASLIPQNASLRERFATPLLRTFTLERSCAFDGQDIVEYLRLHPKLQALSIGGGESALAILNCLAGDGSKDVPPPCLNLQYIRFVGCLVATRNVIPAEYGAFGDLLRTRPQLKLEWVGSGPMDGFNALSASFGDRVWHTKRFRPFPHVMDRWKREDEIRRLSEMF